MKLRVRSNIDEVLARLKVRQDQVPFVIASTLTQLAVNARKEVQDEMRRVFDRPTPYAINSVRIEPATKTKLTSVVWLKGEYNDGRQQSFMRPQVFGGSRPQKRFEQLLQAKGILPSGWFAIPGKGARLDSRGNMSRGQIVQVLSVLQAFNTAGFNANRTKQSAKRNKKARNYFAVTPNSPGVAPNKGRLPFGVWEAFGAGQKQRRNILFFVPAVNYKPKLSFFAVVDRVRKRDFDRVLEQKSRAAMATARSK